MVRQVPEWNVMVMKSKDRNKMSHKVLDSMGERKFILTTKQKVNLTIKLRSPLPCHHKIVYFWIAKLVLEANNSTRVAKAGHAFTQWITTMIL